jgi:uroporphyrinogen decarboxylase
MDPTPRQRAIAAFELKPPLPGLVPAMELEFQLVEERFGRSYHAHEEYAAADDSARERLLREDTQLWVDTCIAYELCCTLMRVHWTPPGGDFVRAVAQTVAMIRELSGDELLTIMHGDATLGLPDGNRMWDLSVRMLEDRDNMLRELGANVDRALALGEKLVGVGVDGFALCADYCYNTGPWCSPAMFSVFVTPFLKRLVEGYRAMGAYVIKHTDGNIMPILDQLLEGRPHALHSLDPQAGVDIAEVKRLVGDRVCLIGNVNCGLLQTGTDEEVIESARYALRHGMPGGGYIFSTSNVAFKGMELARFDLIQHIRREQGVYS